ncbi:MAG: cytosine deaminase [Novosphingobium sp.]
MTRQPINGPDPGEPFVLRNVLVPQTFCEPRGDQEVAPMDIGIANGIIAFAEPAGAHTPATWREVRLERTMALPCFVEAHAHVDSTQIWHRSPNPDGTFASAAQAIIADRKAHWTPEDMRRRMEFGLRCAYAHGVRAMRTHLASQNEQVEQRWELFAELREAWAGRIELQAVPLISTEVLADEGWLQKIVNVVRRHHGVLGAFAPLAPDIDERLGRLFDMAETHGLALDFHADENGDPHSNVLRRIASIALERRSGIPIMVGHCCSLAVQDDGTIDQTLDLVAEAGLAIVSLPSCNLYLQSRASGRTPRWRGVTLLHEMAARGVPICIGSDNCRDPYHPYGDFNPLETFRDAVRIAHLDHPIGDWPRTVTTTPGRLLDRAQPVIAGSPADLVLYRAASFNELLVRPWTVRHVIRNGAFITAELPDFSELEA